MLTIALVWSSSLVFYFIGIIAAIVYEIIKGSEVDIDAMKKEEAHEFKNRAASITFVVWTILAIVFYSGSFEWALGLGSLLSIFFSSVLFSYPTPTPANPCKTGNSMGSSLFVWVVIGIVLVLIII